MGDRNGALRDEIIDFGTDSVVGNEGSNAAGARDDARDSVEIAEDAYKEIANLRDINEHHPLHKLALEEWQRKEKYLADSVSRREERSAILNNQIYNIVGWFLAFQGLVLTAVSQLTQTAGAELQGRAPLCGKIWFPLVLTGFATFVTIVGICIKYTNLWSLEFTIHTEKQAKIEVAYRANTLRRLGPKRFDFRKHTNNALRASKPNSFFRIWCSVIASLLIFTVIFVFSYFAILCDTWVIRAWDGGLRGY